MCLIVDNDVAHRVLLRREDPDFAPVHDALFRTAPGMTARLVYGGRLRDEYYGNHATRAVILELDRKGRARPISDAAIARESAAASTIGLESNDDHIIGLARASGVRLLCTLDAKLKRDFKNQRLVAGKGSVYCKAMHRHLLQRACRRLRLP